MLVAYLWADVENAHLGLADALLDGVKARAVVLSVKLAVLDKPVLGNVVEHLLLCREVVLVAVYLPGQTLTSRVCAPQPRRLSWRRNYYFSLCTGFPLSWLQKIPGLSRTPEAFFHDPVVSQQCLNIERNTFYD